MKNHKKIYGAVLRLLSKSQPDRMALITEIESELTGLNFGDTAIIGDASLLRAEIGEVLNEMQNGGIIAVEDGKYILTSSKPVVLRAERCEKAILDIVRVEPQNKAQIRSKLEKYFGTDKTATLKDDNILHTFIGQILKRLLNLGVLRLRDSKYEIAPQKAARIDDIGDMLMLKGDFLSRLHSRGGEFFEHYFMTLLGKYLSLHGKTVTENYTTGGAADGGIDGIIKTVDTLGFREVTMVQTKNRYEDSNETTLRGFYGAVCAAQGSRGIFATTSDLHPAARKFVDGIDNCVGINGSMIFKMACECGYGIKRRGGKYVLDTKVL